MSRQVPVHVQAFLLQPPSEPHTRRIHQPLHLRRNRKHDRRKRHVPNHTSHPIPKPALILCQPKEAQQKSLHHKPKQHHAELMNQIQRKCNLAQVLTDIRLEETFEGWELRRAEQHRKA